MVKKTFYVTTPIYYINDVPSIGHAYTTIAADILARWKKSKGYNVFFLTGTDENSSKTVQAAKKQGFKDIQKYADSMAAKWKKVWKILNISNDDFIRTTETRHAENVKKFFAKVRKERDIYKSTYEGLYCEGCEAFTTEKELVEGKCPYHKKAPKHIVEENYFFKLSAYEKKLLDYINKNPKFIQPESRKNEVISFIKQGLKNVSISRPDLEWGIILPIDKKHRFWVWFEALINYLVAPKKYWPANLHLIAKDIIRFHCIIWPAMLMSAGHKLPKQIFAHGFLTVNGQKMSKSLGNVIDPVWLSKKYGVDTLRYFLLREIPFGEDGDFSEKTLITRLNSDLADTLGNFVSRALTLIEKFGNGKVPKQGRMFSPEDLDLGRAAEKALRHASDYIEKLEYHHALDEIWAFLKAANRYVDNQKPWAIKEKERLNTVLYTLGEAVRQASALTWPFIPATAEEIAKQLGLKSVPKLEKLEWGKLRPGTKIQKGKILFEKVKIEESKRKRPKEEKEVKKEKQMVSFKEWQKLDLRVGKITEVEDVEGSDKLYKIKIDIGGGETKQTAAALKEHFAPDELMGKRVIFLVNLEPATLRGVKSEGMILAAVKGKEVTLLMPEKDIEIGAKIE